MYVGRSSNQSDTLARFPLEKLTKRVFFFFFFYLNLNLEFRLKFGNVGANLVGGNFNLRFLENLPAHNAGFATEGFGSAEGTGSLQRRLPRT